jgi:hypothetical protein
LPPAAVIELDRSAPWEPPERPRARRPVQRVLTMATVLAVLLGGLSASQRHTSYGTVFTVDGSGVLDMRGDGHTLFLLRQTDLKSSIVEAYRLSDGHRLWGRRMERVGGLLDVGRGMLLLHAPEPGATDSSVIVAVDAADGHEVWRRSDYAPAFYGASADANVVVADPYVPGLEDREQQERRSRKLVGLDVRTGEVAWTMLTPAGTMRSYTLLSDGPTNSYGVSELDPDGTLRVLSTETGRLVHTGHVRDLGPVGGFDLFGDLMMVYQNGEYGPEGTKVFDLTSGRRLWQAPGEDQPMPLWWCGSVLCSTDDVSTTVVDPRTGRVLWHANLQGGTVTAIDDQHMVTGGNQMYGQRAADAVILDSRTGAVLRRLGGWQVIDASAWPRLIVMSREGVEGGMFGALDADTGHATVFGRVAKVYAEPNCRVFAERFICRAGAGVYVWQIPQ